MASAQRDVTKTTPLAVLPTLPMDCTAAKGNPYENAQAERFFRTLNYEEVYLKHYETYEDARANIGEFIEEVYNTKRLHSALGYRPPSEYEAGYARLIFMG